MNVRPILFGQAYYLRFDPKLWAAQQPYPPLGTLYAAAYLRQHGYKVALFDAMIAASEEEWAAALDREQPMFAVLYEDNFNYLSKMCLLRMREAAFTMIELAQARGVPVIVSGSDATDNPGLYLDRGAAYLVLGEGEVSLRELLDELTGSSKRNLSEVRGLCFRDERGRTVRTPPQKLIRDLDSLPFPAWDLVDVDRYRNIWRKRHGHHAMNMVTTRGCPYHCNWCAKPIYGQRYAVRAPEQVVEEMRWMKRTYAPDHLWIADDIFGLKPGWIEQFSALVTAREATLPFKCLMRADQVTAGVAAALARAGCQVVWIGAESGSQRILDAMEKGTRVEQIYETASRLHEAGIEVGFFLQFGYPGETRADIELTLDMIRDCRPDDIGVSVSYPLPGTPFYERVRSELGEKRNWVDSDDLATLYPAPYVPEFYRALHAAVHAEFRLRKLTPSLADVVRRPWSLRRAHVRHAGALAYYTVKLMLLRQQLDRLARLRSAPPRMLVPVLSAHEAAVPTQQDS